MRHAVVIAGGGPTGMMLAGELALAEVEVLEAVAVLGSAFPDG
jgi:2-polyprenyl-6-methoxyphenol hydroxylase-like FAD-dependent oxidoreductase